MKEIGGYFELENFVSNEYYENLLALNSARSALHYLIKLRNIKKIYIPYYLCDVISEMLKSNNYIFEFYNIDYNFRPIFNKKLNDNEYIYIVNYYGQLSDKNIIKFKKKFDRIIVDYTHSFFQKPILGVDTIYTCRKFFGVPDGAYLSTDSRLNTKFESDLSKDKMIHLLGRYEGTASDYYQEFIDADESFKATPIRYMSKLTHNILGAINYKEVRRKRNENYKYLHNKFKEYNKLNLIEQDAPFMYPLYVENGSFIRTELAKFKIYIPTLWPNVIRDNDKETIEYKYTVNILPLPCDQRYGVDDMEYIVSVIRNYI